MVQIFLKKNDVYEMNSETGNNLDIDPNQMENLPHLKELYNDGKVLGFKIPILIRNSNNTESNSFFKIFLKKYDTSELKGPDDYYIRSGITIPKEKNLGKQSVRAILLVEDGKISSFLGDSEEPAHTKWNENTSGFREKYSNGVKALRFVKNSMKKIVEILNEEDTQMHRDLLKKLFFIRRAPEQKGANATKRKKVPEDITPKKKYFETSSKTGGFKVKYVGDQEDLPLKATIRMAYEIERGNAFKRYLPFDFNLSTDLTIEAKNCSYNILDSNKLEINVLQLDSEIDISGFDTNRDIVINLRVVKK
jgi:hypothetical protein